MFKHILELEFPTFSKHYFADEEKTLYVLTQGQNEHVGGDFTTVILKDTHGNFWHTIEGGPLFGESDTITGYLTEYGQQISKERLLLDIASSHINAGDLQPSHYYLELAISDSNRLGLQITLEELQENLSQQLKENLPNIYQAQNRWEALKHFEFNEIKKEVDESTAIDKVYNKEYLYQNLKELLEANQQLIVPVLTGIVPHLSKEMDIIRQLPREIRQDKECIIELVKRQPSWLASESLSSMEIYELAKDTRISGDKGFLDKLDTLLKGDMEAYKRSILESIQKVAKEISPVISTQSIKIAAA